MFDAVAQSIYLLIFQSNHNKITVVLSNNKCNFVQS